MSGYAGLGTVAGFTVLYQGLEPWRAVAVFDLPDGCRTVAYSEDPVLMERMMTEDCCGASYRVENGKFR